MNNQSDRIWYLELKCKGLEKRIKSFTSGKAYVSLRQNYEGIIKAKEKEIERLKFELAE